MRGQVCRRQLSEHFVSVRKILQLLFVFSLRVTTESVKIQSTTSKLSKGRKLPSNTELGGRPETENTEDGVERTDTCIVTKQTG